MVLVPCREFRRFGDWICEDFDSAGSFLHKLKLPDRNEPRPINEEIWDFFSSYTFDSDEEKERVTHVAEANLYGEEAKKEFL